MINKIAGVWFVNHEYDYRPTLDNTGEAYMYLPINHKDYNFQEAQDKYKYF